MKSHCPALHVKVGRPGEGSSKWAAATLHRKTDRDSPLNIARHRLQFPGSVDPVPDGSLQGFPEAVSRAAFDVGLLRAQGNLQSINSKL